MSPALAGRTGKLSESLTLSIVAQCAAMQRNGIDVAKLSVGEPDFNTPRAIKDAGIDAIESNFTRYTAASGILDLRQAICDKLERENGLHYDPTQVVVSSGAKHSLANSLMAVVNEGDEVLWPTPGWLSYPEQVLIAGGVPVPYPCHCENDFRIDLDELEALITPKTKAIIVNSPNNPTGAAYTPEETRAFGELLAKHDIWVISDEIYEKLRYDGNPHTSFASVDGLYDQTIVINGVSKAYCMTGWRIGYLAAPRELASAVSRIQSQMTSSVSSISQKAALRALSGETPEMAQMIQAFHHRRELVVDLLSGIPDITCPVPEGAFYAFPRVDNYFGKSANGKKIEGSLDMCAYLLEEHHVALVPGAAFGAEGHIRISFAASEAELTKGIERVKKGLLALK